MNNLKSIKKSLNIRGLAVYLNIPSLLILLLISFTGILSAQTDYYVSGTGSDGNDGLTSGTPLRTLQEAHDKAGMGPGSTVYVMNGLYTNENNEYVLFIQKSGTPAEALMLRKEGCLLQAQAVLSDNMYLH